MAVDGDSRGLTPLPLFHDMGLIGGVLQPLYIGCEATFIEPTLAVSQPQLWLRAISDFAITHSGGPNFLYELSSGLDASQDRRAGPVVLARGVLWRRAGACDDDGKVLRALQGPRSSCFHLLPLLWPSRVHAAGVRRPSRRKWAPAGRGRSAHGSAADHPVPVRKCESSIPRRSKCFRTGWWARSGSGAVSRTRLLGPRRPHARGLQRAPRRRQRRGLSAHR